MTPELRFPGFSGEWQVKKLGDVAQTVNGLTYSPSDIRESGVLVLRSSNIKKGALSFDDNVYVTKSVKYNQSHKGDILICARNGSQSLIGKNVYIDTELKDTTHGAFMTVLRSDDNLFISQLLKTIKYKKQVHADLGARINSINNAQLLKYKFVFPQKLEQEKIAEFLTAVDSRIAAGEQKLASLTQYKKAVMQQIFSQQIRFKRPDGSNYPDWEDSKLGKVLKEVIEKTDESGSFEVLSSTTKGLFSQKDYFNKEIASADNSGYKVLRVNQIVLSPQNLWMGNINYNDAFDVGIVSPSYKIFEPIGINNDYTKHILKTKRMLYEYLQASEQGASIVRRNLDINSFLDIKIALPCSEEQQKIAAFLTALDARITAETRPPRISQAVEKRTFAKDVRVMPTIAMTKIYHDLNTRHRNLVNLYSVVSELRLHTNKSVDEAVARTYLNQAINQYPYFFVPALESMRKYFYISLYSYIGAYYDSRSGTIKVTHNDKHSLGHYLNNGKRVSRKASAKKVFDDLIRNNAQNINALYDLRNSLAHYDALNVTSEYLIFSDADTIKLLNDLGNVLYLLGFHRWNKPYQFDYNNENADVVDELIDKLLTDRTIVKSTREKFKSKRQDWIGK